ncbi:Bug family tripartite tricarboxylate transporter substrate binding protein [Cupriavidus sp. 2TAF22]|uniref:Bug family tripartite tricarboxylate transporter substrate binding protein n=1 Tax=unclassified Cupriavidus TaxID=2640874 RepID=UPI003F934948
MERRSFLAAVGAAWFGGTTFASHLALAQEAKKYPNKIIRVVVPFPAGGATDNLARALGQELTKATGQVVVVDNKPGGSTIVGSSAVAHAAPDGYTLLLTLSDALTLVPYTIKTPYDPVQDFTPVAQIARTPGVMYMHPSVPATDLAGLVTWMKANPGKTNFASVGPGTSSHLAGLLFNQLAGVDMRHIGYKGSAPALQDLLGGQVQVMFDVMSTVMPYVEKGRLRAMAISSPARTKLAPGVPTFRELGYQGMEQLAVSFDLYAPRGMDRELAVHVNALVKGVLNAPVFGERFEQLRLLPPDLGDVDSLTKQLGQDRERWGEFIRRLGYKPEV